MLVFLAQGAPEPTAQALIERLRSETPEERNAAAEGLKKLGRRALAALKVAVKDSDAEVASRAKQLLDVLAASAGMEEMAKIEKAYSAAGSLEVKVSGESSFLEKGRIVKRQTSCLVYLKGDKESFVHGEILQEGEKDEFTFVSNGTFAIGNATARDKSGTVTLGKMDKFAPTTEINAKIYSILAHGGHGLLVNSIHSAIMADLPIFVSANLNFIDCRDLMSNDGEGPESVLSYRWNKKAGSGELDGKFTLWYKSETSVLLKRMIEIREENGNPVTIKETFSKFVLGEKIPSEKFTLPE